MKIHVFAIIEESYRHGDLNNQIKKYFNSKELRDDYFEFLKKDYIENMNMEEYKLNHFSEKSEYSKWSYYIEKVEEDLEIIESKTW